MATLPPEHDREPSAMREAAADVVDALRAVARPVVDDAISSVSFMVLAVLMVPVGIVIVAVGFVAMALTFGALGSPTGVLGSAITIGWLLGILAALFFSFRALYRRMPRRLRAAYAAPMQPAAPNRLAVAPPRPTPSPPAPTLAELDARLAPQPLPPDAP